VHLVGFYYKKTLQCSSIINSIRWILLAQNFTGRKKHKTSQCGQNVISVKPGGEYAYHGTLKG